MLRNAIIGYPRIGRNRELKSWIEKYFKGKITAKTLQKNAEELRKEQWQLLQNNKIDFITSNDFSFYDSMLDTAYLLNVIPDTYKKLGLRDLDTYFAMARGHQGDEGDVKALTMRKWFNTNYHYMVPVITDDTEIRLNSDKPFKLYKEALSLSIKTKSVLIGPFTFLKLSEYRGKKKPKDFVNPIVKAYKKIINEFNNLELEWLQFDEPFLVTDLDEEDIKLFISLYEELFAHKGTTKILLQTYFGDIRDVYKEIIDLGFDGIGLDFVEGKKTLDLIKKYGFPRDTLLFAGVINGKNIWRNNYEETLNLLCELSENINKENIVISTSCSLLHVPYTLENEVNMDDEYKKYFSFAQEKLDELIEIKGIFHDKNYNNNELFLKNLDLIKSRMHTDEKITQRISTLTKKDSIRNPSFSEREKIQQKALKLPLLPTTTIGSFPQTLEIKSLRNRYKKGKISTEAYDKCIKEKIAECIKIQEEIGLDVLVHGEFERNDMVEYFGENLSGFLFTQNAWVQSYGTRCVKPPIIWGDIKRVKPITVKYSTYAQGLTDKPVKGMLTGPVTILNWSFPREDVSNREMALQIALAIRDEVLELEDNGINIIQIDEAALKEKLPIRREDWHSDYLDWAIFAFRLVHATVKPTTQIHTHMCYSEFEEIVKDIEAMDADVISFEASRSNLSIVEALKKVHFKTAVGPGVYDIHSPRVPSVKEISNTINTMLEKIKIKKLWINPDCGLKTRGETETVLSLKNMIQATKSIRKELK